MRIAKNTLQTVVALIVSLYGSHTYGAESPTCSDGVTLILSVPQASQGGVIVADLRSKNPLDGISGRWSDRDVSFWKTTDSAANEISAKKMAANNTKSPRRSSRRPTVEPNPTGDHREALLGVDLEKSPGSYVFSVTATLADETPVQCTATLPIQAGKFATEKLTVDSKFVEPNVQQAKRAEADQVKLRSIFDHVTDERYWQGPFQMPLSGTLAGTNFGKRRILNGQPRSPHTGADFPSLTGTPVHATQNGRVVLAEELYFSGNTVILDHGLGVYSLYGHLSQIDVAVGDAVTSGSVLGKVGATGRVTGPHLHWGVTLNKARVDPVKLVGAFRPPSRTPRPRRSHSKPS